MPRGRPRRTPPAPGTDPVASPRRTRAREAIPFSQKLILNQWILSLFRVERFEQLAEPLRNEALEGLDENNVHRFHHALTAQFFNLTDLPTDELREYDQSIVRHTQRLNEHRARRGEDAIVWKYFQYLTLLFTEVYLDRYFRDPIALRAELNRRIEAWNAGKPEDQTIALFDEADEARVQLNKLAYWSATGSGKTYLMHVNVLQFQHHLEKAGRSRELNRVILLTPNEGLSRQHLDEFRKSGIEAELFSKEARGLFTTRSVEILDIHKLRDEMGEKTVAADAFEGNNLVLVDEGHRGASGGGEGKWMERRAALCEKGFSFEYSATFGQAVKGKPELEDLYAKSILVDYSYRYFYGDGFGKDYQILNLDRGTQEEHLELYLVAGLLSFFQQLRLFEDSRESFRPFRIERPLWVFVGSSVTASLRPQEASDVVKILQFLARYVAGRTTSIAFIRRILERGLVTASGKDLFSNRFGYLAAARLTPEQVFDESLRRIFNAPAGGLLHVENLKGATGEIAMRVGDNEPFGVINVGDDAKLVKLCRDEGLSADEREFAGSLFHAINSPESKLNLLIGSKKFSEGWSSWRVSTMGLMNVGRSEGAQIIQLFGRGVRLRGYRMSLKRSTKADLPSGLKAPAHIGVLETLGIFGIHADYMAQFRDFLKEEGLPTNEERIEILLPVIHGLGTTKLKTVRLKRVINGVSTEGGHAFRSLGPVPILATLDESDPLAQQLKRSPVTVNWYPKILDLKSSGLRGGDAEAGPNQGWLREEHLAFLDLDDVYFELQQFKAQQGWFNLDLPRESLLPVLRDRAWYRLLIPEAQLAFDSFERVRTWQEIGTALLKKLIERTYKYRKSAWELPHLEYRDLAADDPNFLVREGAESGHYRILIEESQTEIVAKLKELKEAIQRGELRQLDFKGIQTLWFARHLYQPLLYVESDLVEIQPVPLNKGEKRFVEDLKRFHESDKAYFADKELYLLRNQSRGRGVGFFEAGNFHPDFLVWLLVGDRQYVNFVDPKGIRNLPLEDPKVRFHETVKEIEERLGDPKVVLNSFLISNTPSSEMKMMWRIEKAEMAARNVLFQDEDDYVRQLLVSSLAAGSHAS